MSYLILFFNLIDYILEMFTNNKKSNNNKIIKEGNVIKYSNKYR